MPTSAPSLRPRKRPGRVRTFFQLVSKKLSRAFAALDAAAHGARLDQLRGVVAAPATAPVPPPTAAPTAAPGAHPIGSVTMHPIAAPTPAPAAPPASARAPGS